MRIAQLAGNIESVPPSGYGGTEVVVSLLTEALIAQGHEVTLFASGDSKTSARLVATCEQALRLAHDVPQRRWQAFDILTLLKLRKMKSEFDIVHNHMGWQALPWLDAIGIQSVTTNHNPIRDYSWEIYSAYRDLPYVSISNAYRKLNHPDELNYAATIYNGISLSDYPFAAERPGEYLLFLGRVCHDKGTVEAIEIAEKTGLPLKMAGKVDDADQEYFDQKVKPRLKGKIEYVGEVDFNEKLELYKHAVAVVHAINFDEPFGLVMVEAQAVGVPLLALDRGSVREVLADKETAVIGSSVDELVRRYQELSTIKPEACRKRVQDLFSDERMVKNYLELFERLTKNQPVRNNSNVYASS